jgi:radical SAM superfamily enzyme YgiQ (UPF0313 family)
MIILSRKRIVFHYFSYKDTLPYTPVDIGYIIALIKAKYGNKYKFDLVGHYCHSMPESELKRIISEEAKNIASLNPYAVFFFADNIAWSKMHAVELAKKIAACLKERTPKIYIGVQSYKFSGDHIKDLFSSNGVDCAIGSDPEHSFLFLDKILKNKSVSGVIYHYSKDKINNFLNFSKPCVEIEEKSLNYLPSPYLTHVLDKFLIQRQKEDNNFTAFLYSSRGCRFGCYYCARSVKFEKVSFFSAKRFYDEIEYLHSNFGIIHFFILDDAFLFSKLRLEKFIEQFEARKKKVNSLAEIRLLIMTRAELLSEETIKLIKKINVVLVQVGLQTVNPDLQKYMNRKIPINNFKKISTCLEKNGIGLFLDVIIGLPGDSIEYFKKTIEFALEMKPKFMQVKQLYLNPGTLFFVKQEEYEIRAESVKGDFSAPYVLEAFGEVGDEYFREAYKYMVNVIQKHPEISWRLLMREGSYLSRNNNF